MAPEPPRRVLRRRFGATGVDLSQITFGSMRMGATTDGGSSDVFLTDLAAAGIDTHHSSGEYDSHPHYLAAVRGARNAGAIFHHIVKIAEPSWDHKHFDGDRFASAVQREIAQLQTPELAVVQWLVRTKDPTDDATRMGIIERQVDEIRSCFAELRRTGAVRSVATFGYTQSFAERVLETGLATGTTSYLNPIETDDAVIAERYPTIAIRPFCGGKIAPADRPNAAGFALRNFPLVSTSVVSMSSRRHADELIGWAGSVRPRSSELLGSVDRPV